MLSIEDALDMYTDQLNENKKIDLGFYEKQLSKKDHKEFLELIEVVKLGKKALINNEFAGLFDKIDAHKNEIFKTMPEAAGFHKKKKKSDKEAAKNLLDAFKEEFGSEN